MLRIMLGGSVVVFVAISQRYRDCDNLADWWRPLTRRATFTQAELTRAIKAAKSAGMSVTRCEISPDGKIVLSEAPVAPAEDVFGAWKSRRENRVARTS